eukprot:TRINITY_DN1577_c0_g1_i19.p3 TRINITY_DN1577_c0_g1~~TRINITY_DN1577_c0_g1_i19.p3  ORF type:complete len:203 (-),score=35.84 TRINITY_DN1577_c0_g1_i19:151-696(-)
MSAENQLLAIEVKYDQLGISGDEFINLIIQFPEILTQNLQKMGSIIASFQGRGIFGNQLQQIVRKFPLIFQICDIGDLIYKLDCFQKLFGDNWKQVVIFEPELLKLDMDSFLGPRIELILKNGIFQVQNFEFSKNSLEIDGNENLNRVSAEQLIKFEILQLAKYLCTDLNCYYGIFEQWKK